MKIVLAIDSFKGCLTSIEAAEAAAEGIRQSNKDAEIVSVPVSDGGEGMLDAFLSAKEGKRISVNTHDALMRPVVAEYGVIDNTAIIETAQSIGLMLIEKEQRNPIAATSYGVGEIIADAIRKGYHKFIIGLGGSATSDAGIGMLRALLDCLGRHDEHIDDVLHRELGECEFTLASDVSNPLLGDNGAAHIFATQKGATESQIEILENRVRKFADISSRHYGYDCRDNSGAGAAGGLGYSFMQYLGAKVESGAELLLRIIHFDNIIRDADLIITGEGKADNQTLMGKLPGIILSNAWRYSVPVYLIAGKIQDRHQLELAGFEKVECITPENQSEEDALKSDNARMNIKNTISAKIFSIFL